MDDSDVVVRRRRLRVLTFYKETYPKPYVMLAFRIPAFVGYKVSWGMVRSEPAVIGRYLAPNLAFEPSPYIEFLPKGKVPHMEQGPTTMYRLRQEVEQWNRDLQRVALLNRGNVFAIVDLMLNDDALQIEFTPDYPISLRGAYEPI